MIILRSIAVLPDQTGKYRMRVSACAETITLESAPTLVEAKNLARLGMEFEFEEVDRAAWQSAYEGEMHGWADTPSLQSPRTIGRWDHG